MYCYGIFKEHYLVEIYPTNSCAWLV